MSRLVTWAVIAFFAFYLLSDPVGAAGFAAHAGHDVEGAARSLTSFLSNL